MRGEVVINTHGKAESHHLLSFKKNFKPTFRKEDLYKIDHWLGEKRGLVGHSVSSQPATGKKGS